MRLLRRPLVLLVVILGLGLVFDIVARLWVERRIEDRAAAHLHGVEEVDASVSSFPFLARLVVDGEVRRVSLRLREVTEAAIELAELRVDIRGTIFDRRSLLSGGRVEVDAVDEVRLAAVITDGVLSDVTGATVSLDDGEARVAAAGRTVTVRFEVADGRLRLVAEGFPTLSVPLPTAEVLPCEPDVEIDDRRVVLSCTADELPPRVVEAIGNAAARELVPA